MYKKVHGWVSEGGVKETEEKEKRKNNNKNLEGKVIRIRIGERLLWARTRRRRLILLKHFIKLLTKFVVYPLLWYSPYSHTNLCSFLSATECSCNLYRITRNLWPLSESSVNFATVNFNVATFPRNFGLFFYFIPHS